LRKIVVRMPGPSWMENFFMSKMIPVIKRVSFRQFLSREDEGCGHESYSWIEEDIVIRIRGKEFCLFKARFHFTNTNNDLRTRTAFFLSQISNSTLYLSSNCKTSPGRCQDKIFGSGIQKKSGSVREMA